jgi:hypothetical protein
MFEKLHLRDACRINTENEWGSGRIDAKGTLAIMMTRPQVERGSFYI